MAEVTVKMSMPDDQLARLQSHVERQGGDLATYVNEKVRLGLLWDTIDAIGERNRDLTPEEADELADEAVDWARATRP